MNLFHARVQPDDSPIIIRVVQPDDGTGFDFADVLIQALGLTGALLLGSVVLGVLAGALYIGLRILRARRAADEPADDHLRIAPPTIDR